ncbi:Zinc finger, CCHC domain-containing protein [Linnemannia zychae]|nr:Zinc finger, CCHC domain-containing protein [Linnemannia zychae]
MKVNRRQFVGLLYDSILFEYASHVGVDQHHILALADLADTFAFVADFYKHNRPLMDIPCDQFITRNQLHTVIGLLDYIEDLDRGVYEIFPRNVEIREDAPSFASSSSMKRDRRKQQQESLSNHGNSHQQERERGITRSRSALDMFVQSQRGWSTTDIYDHRGHDIHHQDPDTDLDDEYSIVIPGLSKTDIQTFLWEYAYMPEEYQDDIATLIRYLRRDEWMMNGSKGSIVTFDWGLEGVQKYTKEYNQNKIHKVEIREQEEVKRAQEATQLMQEEWNRQQELVREQEAAQRIKATDDFIWRMHKSLVISAEDTAVIDDLIKTLEAELGEYFNFCFLTLAAVGSFATGSHTRYSDLDLTLTGNTKNITTSALADALRHFNYEGVTISTPRTQQPQTSIPTAVINAISTSSIPQPFITFVDPKTETTCHLSLNDPLAIYRSKLVYTYNMAEPRFCPVFLALKRLAVQRHLISGSVHQDRHRPMPLGSYALALMLITFLQTENPPLLPKLQQQTSSSLLEEEGQERDRSVKEIIVQGIDCSFDRDWKYYLGLGASNSKSVAELLMDFCRFFGYVFDYESKEVNARIGSFRWRPEVSFKSIGASTSQSSSSSLTTAFSSMNVHAGPPSSSSSSSSSQNNSPVTSSSSSVLKESGPMTFHVMDPFVMGMNVTAACRGDQVRMVKECFQEVYEALNEGDINHVFSSS